MYNGSAAYDLSLFEPKQAKLEVINNKKMSKRKQRINRINRLLTIASVFICTIGILFCFGFFLSKNVEIIKLNKRIAQQEKELLVLDSEYKRMSNELQSKISAVEVDEYIQIRGMQKLENHQLSYIYNTKKDTATIVEEESVITTVIKYLKQIFS